MMFFSKMDYQNTTFTRHDYGSTVYCTLFSLKRGRVKQKLMKIQEKYTTKTKVNTNGGKNNTIQKEKVSFIGKKRKKS